MPLRLHEVVHGGAGGPRVHLSKQSAEDVLLHRVLLRKRLAHKRDDGVGADLCDTEIVVRVRTPVGMRRHLVASASNIASEPFVE